MTDGQSEIEVGQAVLEVVYYPSTGEYGVHAIEGNGPVERLRVHERAMEPGALVDALSAATRKAVVDHVWPRHRAREDARAQELVKEHLQRTTPQSKAGRTFDVVIEGKDKRGDIA